MALQKLRDPDTLAGVVAQHIEILSAKTCAEISGYSPTTIYKFADPDQELDLKDCHALVELDRACKVAKNRTPYLDWINYTLAAEKVAPLRPVEEEAMEATGAHGAVMMAIHQARQCDSPGGSAITENERLVIANCVRKAQAEHDDIVTAINNEARNAPSSIRPAALQAPDTRMQ